ncbi:MAG: MoxR family ATPase [candidate division WS1 bacterium]|nr:MoxR family ATPase [candidate division WS1 bacterium]
MPSDIDALAEEIQSKRRFVDAIRSEVGSVIVGQQGMVHRLLVALLADGHVLVEGVPGLAKTLTVRTLAQTLETGFQRLQFTPDLLPADIVGTMVYDERDRTFYAKKGPIFSNLILADEINRAPAKVQSALLEAMQERQVTIGEQTFLLAEPFLVMATQNPIEQEGTYPLPEAQVDRFMLKLRVGYPDKEQELQILQRWTTGHVPTARPVASVEELEAARELVLRLYMDERVQRYIVDLVCATREPRQYNLQRLEPLIEYGASPRATIFLTLAAKANAFLDGRGYVTPDDVLAIGMDVMRHRVIVSYEAEAEEVTSEHVVREIFDNVEVP